MHEEAATSMLSDKRVAIVSAHFAPEVGYQEVDLACAFRRLGAHVRVVTSTRLSPNARTVVRAEYQSGLAHTDGYEVVRLSPCLTLGPNVLGCNVGPSIEEFAPDHVILIGPGKLFGLELFSPEPSSWRRIVVLQDNSEAGSSRISSAWGRRSRAVAHRLIKRPAYRRVVRNADRIILNVPETRGMIDRWLGPRERELLARKAVELRLGFDPEKFFFDHRSRGAWRVRHGVDEDAIVLVTCTRATPAKRLEDVISSVSQLRAQGLSVHYVLAGLLDDTYGQRLRRHAGAQPDPTAFLLLPVLRHDEMRELFCASDLGFWPQAAITIQQAMGTGLSVVLRRRPSVSHLLTAGRNGWYVESGNTLEQALAQATRVLKGFTVRERLSHRASVVDFNRSYLSYDVIARQMVERL
jgi:glycosyltransferase involved in cell wall biosynthesis